MHFHKARDSLVVDEVTAAAQLMGHTPIAVAGKLILDALDEMHHLQIAQEVAGFAGAVVERAARKLDPISGQRSAEFNIVGPELQTRPHRRVGLGCRCKARVGVQKGVQALFRID